MRLPKVWPVVLAAALFGLSACGQTGQTTNNPGPPPPGGSGERMKPLVEQFKDARGRAQSDFEREVLDRAIKTGKIEPADYEQAFSRYRQCAQDAGLKEKYTKQPNGIYKVDPPADLGANEKDVNGYMDVMADCAGKAGLIRIEALYRTQVDNPDLIADRRVLVVQCLVKAGLVAADYTPDKLTTFLRSDMKKNPDFDPMHAEAQKCLTAGGMAVQVDPSQKGGS